MTGSYAAAYADKDGNGFSESEPWILDDFGEDIKECIKRSGELNKEGYKSVIPFRFGTELLDGYSWDYVIQQKLDIEI